MRLALQGASGSGKTYSSLLIAYGMTGDWSKVAVIDSENGSADLYAHLGDYRVLTLENYAPESASANRLEPKSSSSTASPTAGTTCWISMPTYKATPLRTGRRSRRVRMPLSNVSSLRPAM